MLSQRELSEAQLGHLADGGHLFAIIDACGCHQAVMEKAYHGLGPSKAVCLLRGTYMASYDAVAPYLFSVDRKLLEWIGNALEKESWGIFVLAKANLMELQGHMQRFLLVLLPDQRKWFFRYYDPRILRAYLPTCNAAELRMFFGPILGFAVRDPGTEKIFLLEQSASATGPKDANCLHPSGLWLIRPEQVHGFSKATQDHFLQLATEHAQQFFPELCSRMGGEQFLVYIRYGVARAASYGIIVERQISRYLDLMFAFGKDFDRNPQYAWASEILKDPLNGNAEAKLDRIFEIVASLANRRAAING